MASRWAHRRSWTVAVVVACLAGPQALAHSWYPAWCCSDRDCRELMPAQGEAVTETKDGYRLWDGRLISRDQVKPSPDEHFHICEEPVTRAIICFFAPQGET